MIAVTRRPASHDWAPRTNATDWGLENRQMPLTKASVTGFNTIDKDTLFLGQNTNCSVLRSPTRHESFQTKWHQLGT